MDERAPAPSLPRSNPTRQCLRHFELRENIPSLTFGEPPRSQWDNRLPSTVPHAAPPCANSRFHTHNRVKYGAGLTNTPQRPPWVPAEALKVEVSTICFISSTLRNITAEMRLKLHSYTSPRTRTSIGVGPEEAGQRHELQETTPLFGIVRVVTL